MKRKTENRIWAGALTALLLTGAAAAGRAEVINRIVLRVNDRIATLADYQRLRRDYLQELSRSELDGADRERLAAQIGERVFRDLFEELLLLSRADQLQVEVPESEVSAALDRMREEAGLETREEFAQALISSGIDPVDFHARMRDRLRMEEVVGEEVQREIEVTDEMTRRFYRDNPQRFRVPEKVHLEEVIVLEDSGLAADERRRLAEEIRRRVEAGEELAEVVAEHAESGRTSAVVDLGWIERGELDTTLEEAAWDLAPDTLSEPVEARGGLHLLRVRERQEERMRPFQEVVQQIRAFERQRQFAEKYQKYLERLEKSAFVRLAPPPEAEGFRTITGTLAEELETPEMGEETAEEALEEELQPAADTTETETAGEPGEVVPPAPEPEELSEPDPGPEPSDPPLPPR